MKYFCAGWHIMTVSRPPPPAALSAPMRLATESAWHSRRLLGPAEPSWSAALHADCYNTFNTILPLPSTCPKHTSYFHASGLDLLLRMSFPPALKSLELLSYVLQACGLKTTFSTQPSPVPPTLLKTPISFATTQWPFL